MSTPGTPLPDDVEYDSHIDSPPLAFTPYGSAEGHSTFLNYRNPEGAAIGGASAVNQAAYANASSTSDIKHRKTTSDDYSATGDRRRTSSASNAANMGLTSNGLLGNQKTGHDAVEDMSAHSSSSWGEHPLVMTVMVVGFVAAVVYGWVVLGSLNKEGKRSLIEIL